MVGWLLVFSWSNAVWFERFSDVDMLNMLRQIEFEVALGCDVAEACRKVGISDATYYTWRK